MMENWLYFMLYYYLITLLCAAVLLVINCKYPCNFLGFWSQRMTSVLRFLPAPGLSAQALGSTTGMGSPAWERESPHVWAGEGF